MRKLILLFALLLLIPFVIARPLYNDDFEDGIINSVLWDVILENNNGAVYGNGLNASEGNGHLSLNISVASLGTSQQGVSILRSKYNFNDGFDHLFEFTMNLTHSLSGTGGYELGMLIDISNGSNNSAIADCLYITAIGSDCDGRILKRYLQNTPSQPNQSFGITNFTLFINQTNNNITLYNSTNGTRIPVASIIHTQNNSNWFIQFRSYTTGSNGDAIPAIVSTKLFNFQENASFIGINHLNYTNPILEGGNDVFRANISLIGISGLSGTLIYNNTNYSATTSDTGNERVYTVNIIAPSVNQNSNIPFYWNFILTAENSTITNLSSAIINQTVIDVGVDNCTTNTIRLMNLTIRDEDTQTAFTTSVNDNLTVQIDLDINNIIFFNSTFLRTNPVLICISTNLTANSSLDAQIQYSAFDHVTEFYHLQNFTINNRTIPLNISLYDLDVLDSQEFLITVKGTNFLPLTGALVEITRKYIGEGVFKTVEIPLTDSLGRTIGHFVLADQIYTILIKKNGQLLGTFENVQLACQDLASGDCRLNLNLASTGTEPEDFTSIDGVVFYINYDEGTRIVTGTFSTLDGSIQTINLNVSTSINNSFVCSNTLTSNSGSLSCTVPSSFDNVQVTAKLSKGQTLLGQKFIFIATSTGEDVFGELAYFIAFLLILCMCLMVITDRQVMLIFAMLGVMLCVSLLIIDGGGILGMGSTALFIIVTGGLYIWKIGRVTR